MIHCIGAGPGDLAYLTEGAKELIRKAEVVAGFDAVVDMVRPLIPKNADIVTMGYKTQVERLAEVAAQHHAGKRCVVVFMGDIHFSGFQFLERVEQACGHRVSTWPGISSAQILASKARVCFDETTFLTLHRRGDVQPFKIHLVHALADGRNAIVIPRPWDFMPRAVAAFLLENGVPPAQPVEVWERLTGDEAEWRGTLADCAQKPDEFSDLSIMLIRSFTPVPSQIESPESGAVPGVEFQPDKLRRTSSPL